MEISLSNDLLRVIIWLPPALFLGVLAYRFFLNYRQWKAKRWAENKVRMSDRILLFDIKALAKSKSPLLGDAIALHCAQMEQERNPGD